jgi:hypothetical protein
MAMYQRGHWFDARCEAGDIHVASILVLCGPVGGARPLRGRL